MKDIHQKRFAGDRQNGLAHMIGDGNINRDHADSRKQDYGHTINYESLTAIADPTHVIASCFPDSSTLSPYAAPPIRKSPALLRSPKANKVQSYQLIEDLRFHLDSKMDDKELQLIFQRSNVVVTKDFREWDMRVCLELLGGALCTPHGLQVAFGTKLIKRLLSFLRPEKKLFGDLSWNKANFSYVTVACRLFQVLLGSKEGYEYQYFVECVDQIFTELAKEVRGDTGASAGVRPFSRENMSSKLCREYVTLIGVLCSHERGLAFLEKNDFYKGVENIMSDPSKDYLTRLFISHLDYGISERARRLLQTWVDGGSVSLRHHAISHLRLLLRRGVEDFSQWGVSILVSQVQWTGNTDVALAALNVLEEACLADPSNVVALMKSKPDFTVVGNLANNLLTHCLSHPAGVEYLMEKRWIEPQLKAWSENGNEAYVKSMEKALFEVLNQHAPSEVEAHDSYYIQDTTAWAGESKDSVDGGVPSASCGYVGPFGGFGGFRSTSRTKRDQYRFDSMHSVPWTIEIYTESSQGNRVQLLSEAFMHSIPTRADDSGLVSVVLGVVLDVNGKPMPYRIDQNVTIKASLRAGDTYVHGKGTSFSCTRELRQSLSASDLSVSHENCKWSFVYDDKASSKSMRRIGGDDGPALMLESVSFVLDLSQVRSDAVVLAPHFYGELAKTEEGCLVLRSTGHVDELADVVRSVGNPDATNTPLQQRAALWAIGNIGACENGVGVLLETDVIQSISQSAMKCPTLSMRGVCFYVLGLVSQTKAGMRLLKGLGWLMASQPGSGILLPADFASFIKVSDGSYHGAWALDIENTFGLENVPVKTKSSESAGDQLSTVRTILGYISNVSNKVTQTSAVNSLKELRGAHPQLFQHPLLLREVFKLLENQSYKLPARRFIMFDLFNQTDWKAPYTYDSVFDVPLSETQTKDVDTIAS